MDDGWVGLWADESVLPRGTDSVGRMAASSAVSMAVSKDSRWDEWSAESSIDQTVFRWGVHWAA
jgi:hypothetical protein